MRNFITWTLSILLGFEPAVLAQGQAEQRAAIVKAWIEESQIAQKPMTVRELYQRASKDLPEEKLKDFKKFVDQYGDRNLPKMDISKVSGPNGREFYRMQGTAAGKAITVEFFQDGVHPARVNGKVITHEDFSSVRQLMSTLGVPVKAVNEYFPRKPTSVGKFFSAEQINQLKDEDRNRYFKQIRQLMESMEAVDDAFGSQSTSQIDSLNRFEVIAMLLQGEWALAAAGDCVAAGHIVPGGMQKGLPCGSDPKGGINPAYRTDSAGYLRCSSKQLLCNETIYASEKTLCVDAGPESTKKCNNMVDDKTAFKQATKPGVKPELVEKFFRDAQTHAEKVWATCNENFPDGFDATDSSSSSGSIFPPKESKAKNGKSKKSSPRDMREDQRLTCKEFENRLDDIKGWCNNYPEFKSKYPNLCGGESKPQEPAPVPPPVAPVAPVADQCQGLECCDKLGNDRGTDSGSCDSSGGTRTKEEKMCFNLQTKKQEIVYKCDCNNGYAGKMKCNPLKQITEDEPFREDKKKKKKKDDDINWLIVGGVGLGMMWFMYDMQKKSLPEIYKPFEPIQQNPPTAPPTNPTPGPAAPVPRGAI